MLTNIFIKGDRLNEKLDTDIDVSRRKLLKKAYTAPAVIALGSMTFAADADAWGGAWGHHKHFSGCGHNGGGSSSSSSLSGGQGWCSMCKKHWPCSHHP